MDCYTYCGSALTNGKSSVIVKFQAKSGENAGGVYDRVEMVTLNMDVTWCFQEDVAVVPP
jgi:hypothetical protein